MKQLKSAWYATNVWLYAFYTGQSCDWWDCYERRIKFYEMFED